MSVIKTVNSIPSAENGATSKTVTVAGVDLIVSGVGQGWFFKYTSENVFYQVESVDSATTLTVVETITASHAGGTSFILLNGFTPNRNLQLPGSSERLLDGTIKKNADLIETALGLGPFSPSAAATLSSKTGVVDKTLTTPGAGFTNRGEILDDSDGITFRPSVTTDTVATSNWIELYGRIVVKNLSASGEKIWGVLEYAKGSPLGSWVEVNRWQPTHWYGDTFANWSAASGGQQKVKAGEYGLFRITEMMTGLDNNETYTFRFSVWYDTNSTSNMTVTRETDGAKRFYVILHH